MKTVSIVIKVLVALAAIAGIVYVVATYGDKIVAWAKKTLCLCKSRCNKVTFAEDMQTVDEADFEG